MANLFFLGISNHVSYMLLLFLEPMYLTPSFFLSLFFFLTALFLIETLHYLKQRTILQLYCDRGAKICKCMWHIRILLNSESTTPYFYFICSSMPNLSVSNIWPYHIGINIQSTSSSFIQMWHNTRLVYYIDRELNIQFYQIKGGILKSYDI